MSIFQNRNRELFGLMLVFISLLLGFSQLLLTKKQSLDPFTLRLPLTLGLFFFLAHLAVRLKTPKADCSLLPIAFLLVGIGSLMIFQLQPDLSGNQVTWVSLGLALMVLTILFLADYNNLADFKYIFGLFGLGMLLAPIFFGYEVGGAKLWLSLGGHSIQPAEFAKLFLVIFFAAYLEDKQELLALGERRFFGVELPAGRYLAPLLSFWLLSLAVLIFEKDLGSSLIFFTIFLAMLYVSTGRLTYIFSGGALFLVGALLSYLFFNHVQTRVGIWLRPLPADVSGDFYQAAQSLFALAGGGLTGTGVGAGFLGSRIHMPAVLTDFIFAAVAEETGLAGASALVLAYLYFVYRGFKIAVTQKSAFGRLLIAGLTFSFGFQVLVIVGGVIKVVPLTGVTLPFVSYGGSSIIASFILLALLLSASNKGAENE